MPLLYVAQLVQGPASTAGRTKVVDSIVRLPDTLQVVLENDSLIIGSSHATSHLEPIASLVLSAILVIITAYYAHQAHRMSVRNQTLGELNLELQKSHAELQKRTDEDRRSREERSLAATAQRVKTRAIALAAMLRPIYAECLIVSGKGENLHGFATKYAGQLDVLLSHLISVVSESSEAGSEIRDPVTEALRHLARAQSSAGWVDLFWRVNIDPKDPKDVKFRDDMVRTAFTGITEGLAKTLELLEITSGQKPLARS